MFYGSEIKTMMPKLHSENFEGLELIRPLYLVKEESIISWRKHNDLTFINCACRFIEGCSLINDGTSKRKEMKELIKTMKQVNSNVDQNIFNTHLLTYKLRHIFRIFDTVSVSNHNQIILPAF